jgi:hypothetical protein
LIACFSKLVERYDRNRKALRVDDTLRWVVAQHLGHDIAVDLLELKEILLGELCPVAFIE